MDSPSYLEPAIGLWDWIIWGRLESNSSGIHRLLKAIWQCFHTLISVASPLTVSGGCQNKGRFLLDILTDKNIKSLITVECVVCSAMSKSSEVLLSPSTYILVFTTWDVSPSLPAWLICVFTEIDFQHSSKNENRFSPWLILQIRPVCSVCCHIRQRKTANPHIWEEEQGNVSKIEIQN